MHSEWLYNGSSKQALALLRIETKCFCFWEGYGLCSMDLAHKDDEDA